MGASAGSLCACNTRTPQPSRIAMTSAALAYFIRSAWNMNAVCPSSYLAVFNVTVCEALSVIVPEVSTTVSLGLAATATGMPHEPLVFGGAGVSPFDE